MAIQNAKSMRISERIILPIFHYVGSTSYIHAWLYTARRYSRSDCWSQSHSFFLSDIGLFFSVDDLSTTLPSYDVQITSATLPLSPKPNTRLGLQPDTVSELPLRLVTVEFLHTFYAQFISLLNLFTAR